MGSTPSLIIFCCSGLSWILLSLLLRATVSTTHHSVCDEPSVGHPSPAAVPLQLQALTQWWRNLLTHKALMRSIVHSLLLTHTHSELAPSPAPCTPVEIWESSAPQSMGSVIFKSVHSPLQPFRSHHQVSTQQLTTFPDLFSCSSATVFTLSALFSPAPVPVPPLHFV